MGKLLLLRWEQPHGWVMGTIVEKITSATPRLFKKFHYRINFSDGGKGPATLPLDNYASGEDAAYNSCCLLERDEPTE